MTQCYLCGTNIKLFIVLFLKSKSSILRVLTLYPKLFDIWATCYYNKNWRDVQSKKCCRQGSSLKMLGLYLDTLYNQSQMLQFVKNTKWINIAKGIATFRDKIMCFGQKGKNTTTTTTNKKSNIKILARDGSRRRDFSHCSPMRCLLTTKTTEHIYCYQAIKLRAVKYHAFGMRIMLLNPKSRSHA